jgi:hypothetical protein
MNGQSANFVNSLQGKIAGVSVTNSGGSANAGSQIIIRSISSINPSQNNEPLFIVDGIDIREEPKKHDVYGRYIEIICINQCNKLFEDKIFGKDSDIYLLFSMVGLLSIELEGREYERRMNQIAEMLRNKYF